LEPFFHALESTFVGTTVRQSLWMFPVIECIHLLALALLGGTVLAVDMRLLGIGLQAQPPSDLLRKLQPYMTAALVTSIVTGLLMFLSEAIKCYFSPPFWYKMGCLVLACTFAFTIRKRVVLAAPGRLSPIAVKLTALVSLALWFGVGFSGRWIAFY
jgi:hypothetical protein